MLLSWSAECPPWAWMLATTFFHAVIPFIVGACWRWQRDDGLLIASAAAGASLALVEFVHGVAVMMYKPAADACGVPGAALILAAIYVATRTATRTLSLIASHPFGGGVASPTRKAITDLTGTLQALTPSQRPHAGPLQQMLYVLQCRVLSDELVLADQRRRYDYPALPAAAAACAGEPPRYFPTPSATTFR
jgi:hypothetical protein